MRVEEDVTIRNAGLLLVQQGGNFVSGLFFAILVPRLMGPDLYGRYALVTSLALWFVIGSALGFTPILNRYVPQFVLQGDDLRPFLERLLTLRLLSGGAAAGLYLLLTRLWLHELDPAVLLTLAAFVPLQTLAYFLFAVSLGLNQAARWGMGQLIRGWVSLALLLVGFYLGGLRGACLGLLLTELVVLALGAWWTRPYLARPRLRLDLRTMLPYLRFGLIFFASDLLLTAVHYTGQALVRVVSGDYRQVGYFSLAYSTYRALALIVPQLTASFAPLFTTLLARGQADALRDWSGRLLKWLAIGGVVLFFGVLLLGEDVVPMVFGPAYAAVAVNLLPLMLTLLVVTIVSVNRLLALVTDRPGVALAAAAVQVVAFWGLGVPLVAWGGSLGGALAVLVAAALYAVVFTWRTRQTVRYSLRGWASVILLAVPFLMLSWLRGPWSVNGGLYVFFIVVYGGLLYLFRLVTPGEIAAARQALRMRGSGVVLLGKG